MKNERLSVNEKENWGGLVDAALHTAAIGARIADSRHRDFMFFPDRMTVVGDGRTARMLEKWALGKKMIKAIKKNTRFSYYGRCKDENWWSTSTTLKGVHLVLSVRCCGEYVHLAAYADKLTGMLDVIHTVDEENLPCWDVLVGGEGGDFPRIYAGSREDAMEILVDYVRNELAGRRDEKWKE